MIIEYLDTEAVTLFADGDTLYCITRDDDGARCECLEPCDADPLAELED